MATRREALAEQTPLFERLRLGGERLPRWVWACGPYVVALVAAPVAYAVFALMLVLAQAIERLLVPFGTLVDNVKPEADVKGTPHNGIKTAWMWALATSLALFTCAWFGVLLLAAIGINDAPQWFDLAATALVIGAGTKPLHDLISNLQSG